MQGGGASEPKMPNKAVNSLKAKSGADESLIVLRTDDWRGGAPRRVRGSTIAKTASAQNEGEPSGNGRLMGPVDWRFDGLSAGFRDAASWMGRVTFFKNKPTKLLKTLDSVAKRDKTIPISDRLVMACFRAFGSIPRGATMGTALQSAAHQCKTTT